jgi:hypothetical protein
VLKIACAIVYSLRVVTGVTLFAPAVEALLG